MRHTILIVEGESEYWAIPRMLEAFSVVIGRPIIFRGQGVDCSISVLVRQKLLRPAQASILSGCGRIIVIIDLEMRADCPGAFAQKVADELRRQLRAQVSYTGVPPLSVVCANRCLENWLLADPEGIQRHNYIAKRISGRVGGNADGVDAIAVLKWAYKSGRQYDKVADAPALARSVRVTEMRVRQRSKSLDKFLREVGV